MGGGKEMKSQVEPGHYFALSYDSKERIISYWYQIKEIIELKPERVLEIGIGNGFVSKYLKNQKINILTLDFDERLKPDISGSILNIPFADESFDTIASYELLEHLPYEDTQKALREIYRVTQKYTILSIPDCTKVYKYCITIPKIGIVYKLISLPCLKASKHIFDGQHYWEIGKKGYSLNKVMNDMQRIGFKVKRTYRLWENPYHRFFILEKSTIYTSTIEKLELNPT
jgi:ubiquinone/menaquinone biosynthesis C-methylase UbiE